MFSNVMESQSGLHFIHLNSLRYDVIHDHGDQKI
jgi:hypothetical protein